MTRLAENWTELLAKLAAAQVEFIVVGGVAAILGDEQSAFFIEGKRAG